MAKKPKLPPQKSLDAFDKIFEGLPDIERKGVTNPYTSANTYMFTHLNAAGEMGLRLGKEDREAFIEKYDTRIHQSHGHNMPDFVMVPFDVMTNMRVIRRWVKKSLEHTMSLKPKKKK